MSKNFKNIQVQSRLELAEEFESAYLESGVRSKGEFLGNLLENYLNPNTEDKETIAALELENTDLISKLENPRSGMFEMEESQSELQKKVNHYENNILHLLYEKHRGETLKFKSTMGQKVTITIDSIEDVYTAVINSIKV